MFRGVEHIGVGVADMEDALAFFGDRLGFTRKVFDFTGSLPGVERVTGRDKTRARVVMLGPTSLTPLGSSGIKLVQLLDRDAPPLPDGMGWGELGIAEVCLHAVGQEKMFRHLVDDLACESLMEPLEAPLPPHGTTAALSYIADPYGGKIELIEWPDIWKGLPAKPRLEGVNHVAFGVRDMDRTREFYARFGFTETVFDYDGEFEPMAPWYEGAPPSQHILLLTSWLGADIEPVQHDPPSPDMRGEWGHLGPMEFAIGVANLDRAYEDLSRSGIEFHSGPQSVESDTGEWRYAYMVDPDDLYVALVEARY
jgi:catechol 2,3-dioxygenase-like lactoylglutathione lyase family enzyme